MSSSTETCELAFLGICRASVNLDMDSTEYYAGEKIKRALARYPLHVIRADVDPETNPFGLQWDCYSDTPQRIELEEPVAPTKREGGL